MREARDEIKLKFHGDKSAGGAVRRDAILRAPIGSDPTLAPRQREREKEKKFTLLAFPETSFCTAKFSTG